jgi:hypothetical protein
MKTRLFKDVLKAICAHRGHVLTDDYLSSRPDLAQFVNDRLRHAWNFTWWRDLLAIERRYYRPAYAAGTAYPEGKEVWYSIDGVVTYFRSMAADNLGVTPGTDDTKWRDVSTITDTDVADYEFIPSIAGRPDAADFDGGSEIGEKVRAVTEDDPRRTNSDPQRIDFMLHAETIWITDSRIPAAPFVQFMPPVPIFTTDAWNGETAAKDDLTYSAERGQCYRSLEDDNTDTPGESAKWVKVEFPAVLFDFVARTAYCDFIRADGISGQDAEAQRRKVDGIEERAEERLWEDAVLHAEQSGRT